MALSEGQIIAGRFRATRVLGAGGMGEVWAADVLRDGREVALKILSAASRKHAEVVTRFRREAFLLGRIKSSHVARIIEFIDDEAVGPVLVMELIAGRSLLSILEERKLGVEEAVFLARDLGRALCDLHAVNIVHRDLKPGNIIMRPDADNVLRAVVVDFGIGRQLASEGEEITGITRANIALGTVEYMAPEQILDSREVTPLADIYACGAILFRAVAGHHVYGARRDQELARAKLLEDPPRLPAGPNEISRGLADLVARCLVRKPKQRLASAKQLVQAVNHLEERVRVSMMDLDSTTTQDSDVDSGPRTLVEREVQLPDDRLATARRPAASGSPHPAPVAPAQPKVASQGSRAPMVQPSPGQQQSGATRDPRPALGTTTTPMSPAMANEVRRQAAALGSDPARERAPAGARPAQSEPRDVTFAPRDGVRGPLPSFQELSSAAAQAHAVRGSLPSIPESQPRFHSTADVPAMSRPHADALERRRGVSRSTFGLGLLLALSAGAAGGFVLAESQHRADQAAPRAGSAAPEKSAASPVCSACPEPAACPEVGAAPSPSASIVALGQELPAPVKTAAPQVPRVSGPMPTAAPASDAGASTTKPAAPTNPTSRPTSAPTVTDLDTLER